VINAKSSIQPGKDSLQTKLASSLRPPAEMCRTAAHHVVSSGGAGPQMVGQSRESDTLGHGWSGKA
jgi:hypothetical protein